VPAEGSGAPSRPLQRAGASTVALDDNVAVYDDVGQLLVLLNPSAAAVWEHCDGATTVDDMVEELAAAYPDDAADIGQDVRLTVRKLVELGLVVDAPA
jgi:Coenzyme PQQ synthesis protein D (PqqD)